MFKKNFLQWIVSLIAGIALVGTNLSSVRSQPREPSNPRPARAIAGEPFGVVSLEIPMPAGWNGGEPRVLVREQSGRIFYPVVTPQWVEVELPQEPLPPPRLARPGGIIDQLRHAIRQPPIKKRVVTTVLVDALFRGSEPLIIQVAGDVNRAITVSVDPKSSAELHGRFLEGWWAAYTEDAARFLEQPESHKSVQQYLVSMLASRLNLPSVDLSLQGRQSQEPKLNLQETFELLAPTQELKEDVLASVLREPKSETWEELSVPLDPKWEAAELPAIDFEVPMEALAGRVPPECFYLRFGSFSNYLWFHDVGQRLGEEISGILAPQRLDDGSTARAEKMLGMRITTVSKMFGDQLIQDMAFFGTDLYFGEGASMAVLFHASNSALLNVSFQSDRNTLLKENPDATLAEVEIAGKKASLLSTPDNRIRAFLLVDDPFVLVTTSRHLAERFLQIAGEQQSLASSNTFRWVRHAMPDSNDYSVFGYFPPEFFQNLLGPHYQIELHRRLQAAAHLEIAEIASRVAFSEGAGLAPNEPFAGDNEVFESIDAMREVGVLPPWFDERADGTRVLRSGDRWVDSLRGGRGSFLPIADVKPQFVSAEEATQYAKVTEYFRRNWRRMDPLFFGLRRFEGDREGEEQFSIEAFLAPFEPAKYGWITEKLAEPSPVAIEFPEDDLVSVQMRMQGTRQGESYYLFGGIRDMLPPDPEDVQGLIRSLRAFKAAPAYLGAWPKPDIIEQLPLGIGSRMALPDFAGYSRMIGGLWRWQDSEWSLLSFHKNILDSAAGQISLSESTDVAQVRISVADWTDSQLAVWANRTWWQQGWRSNQAATDLLDSIDQQLHVPPTDGLDVVERLTGSKVQCALGGSFELTSTDFSPMWASTASSLGSFNDRGKPLPPESYTAPWLQWFRGARVHATQRPGSLSIVGLVRSQHAPPDASSIHNSPATPTSVQSELLPMKDFNVFELPLQMFGEKSKLPPLPPKNPGTKQQF